MMTALVWLSYVGCMPLHDEPTSSVARGKSGALHNADTTALQGMTSPQGQDWEQRWHESQEQAKRRHVSLVQTDQANDLMAKWRAATDYKTRRAVCDAMVHAGAEGARVIIELGRDADVKKAHSQTAMLSQCLERMGEAAKPALFEYLNLPDPATGIDVSRAIAAWPPDAIDELIRGIDRDQEKPVIAALSWVQNLSHRIALTESMKAFVLAAVDHRSPRVRVSVLGDLTLMMDLARSGHGKVWVPPPVERIEHLLSSSDPDVRVAAFRFFGTTDRNPNAYASAKKAIFDTHEKNEVRYVAARILAANAPDDHAILEDMMKVDGILPRVEAAYIDGLRYRELPEAIIPILCRWLVAAEDYYMATNLAAAHLKKFGAKAVPGLLENVANAEWNLVARSLGVLFEIPGSESLIPDKLRPRLQELVVGGPRYNLDPVFTAIAKYFPRNEAFQILTQFGNHPEAAKLGLRPAIGAIGMIRPVDGEMIAYVRNILQRPDEGLRYHAIQAVGNMESEGAALVSDLLHIIETDSKLRDRAIYQVWQIKTVESDADLRRLLRLAESKPSNEYQTETAIIARILKREPKYFEVVRQSWSQRPEMLLRLAVARVDAGGNVLNLPPGMQESVFPLLVELYVHRSHVELVSNALVSIGRRDQRVIDEARRRVADEDPSVAGEALELIAQLRPVHETEVRLVLESLQTEDMGFRRGAAAACAHLGSLAGAALPRLMQIAQTPGDWGRIEAIRALGEISPPLPEVIQLLQGIAMEPIEQVENASARALARIAARHPTP